MLRYSICYTGNWPTLKTLGLITKKFSVGISSSGAPATNGHLLYPWCTQISFYHLCC